MRAILLSLIFFLLLGIFLEGSHSLSGLKRRLQDRSIHAALQAPGERGKMMRTMGLEYVVPSQFEQGSLSGDGSMAVKSRDSLLVPKSVIASGISIMALVVDDSDLYDKDNGIFHNFLNEGREWERPCYVSYYNEGMLQFKTAAGVRVHGGKCRYNDIKHLRLFFRHSYGFDHVPKGLIFSEKSDPLRHIVLRDTKIDRFRHILPLAFEIAGKVGCNVPETRPAKVYLNGVPYGEGDFVMLEHLSRQYINAHYGHEDFVHVRMKDTSPRPPEYLELIEWANDKSFIMTMEEAGKKVDLENLISIWIAQVFCANTDTYQGMALLDRKDECARWFWVNWDMDHAFQNKYEKKRLLWQQKMWMKRVLKEDRRERVKAVLFQRLRKEDPKFNGYFFNRITEVFNHDLTQQYLGGLVDYYEDVAIDSGIDDRAYIDDYRLFMKNRIPFSLTEVTRLWGAPESHKCSLTALDGAMYRVDGHESGQCYSGHYFNNSKITVEITGRQDDLLHWKVNGGKVKSVDGVLEHVVTEDTVIEPVFADS